ncbi:MAG: adenosylmethionine--8-amino-7-oxononanoate transaminase [Legionella sp.]
MKDFELSPPLIVERSKGSFLYTNQGEIIDGISSWWCKSLGHGSPIVIKAVMEQLNQFEHVITANTTSPSMVELAELLASISGLQRIFFASDGACAVEIAMKLALHSQQLKGKSNCRKFIALKNSYHGETLGTLAISDVNRYKTAYHYPGLQCHFIENIPYVNCEHDPLWQSCDNIWPLIEVELNAVKTDVCALIVEPIVQGAGGMLAYSADFLSKLASWAKDHDIYLIADEIMTGLGRTGAWLASHHANIKPDMICLSKGLTSGCLPLSCVLIDNSIYELFYSEYEQGKNFLHSHTYSGNALGISAALATLKEMHRIDINHQAQILGKQMWDYFSDIATRTNKLNNIRSLGAWIAGDLETDRATTRIGHKLHNEALSRGALLRPINNTLYWLPPLTTDQATIARLAEITLDAIYATYR